MRKWNHTFLLLAIALTWKWQNVRYSLKNKLGDRMIKQLLNSVITKYCDLSVSRPSLRLRQIIDLLVTGKSRYFAQPRPIIAKYHAHFASRGARDIHWYIEKGIFISLKRQQGLVNIIYRDGHRITNRSKDKELTGLF